MKKWLDKYEAPKAQDGTILPRNLDPKYKAAIAEDKERLRQSQATVKSTKPFEVKDTRSLLSDSRAKERADAAWNAMQKGTALAAYFPHPLVSNSAVALNSGMGLIDAYYANQEGDTINRNINLVGAAPIPSYTVAKSLGEGLGNKFQSKANKFALMMLGLDAFGTAADLTNNFEFNKKQNGGAIEGTMGGLTDVGFNYNGAWGGTMQGGGYIDSVLNANKNLDWVQRLYEKNTPSIKIPGQKGRSTHFMESADGRVYPTVVRMPNGKLKYLADKAYDYADSTKTYIQFPSDEAAKQFGENYKKGTGVLKDFAMGGNLPGTTGMMYARTGAPSNGPYAKKTMASAQNGKEMKFYQEGLDFKPKTISQDGTRVVIPKRDLRTLAEAEAERRLANQPVIQSPKGKQLTKEEVKEKNKKYAQKTGKKYNEKSGAVEDRFTPNEERVMNRAVENIIEPMTIIEGGMAAAPLIKKGLQSAGKYLTEQTALKNAYKLNPKALKENPEMFLYRARPVGQNIDMNMAAQLRAKEAAGESLKWYEKNLLNPQTNPQILSREKYYGRWFEKDPSRLDFYMDPGRRNFADDDVIEILRTKLPTSEANKLNVSQFDDAKILSMSPETEFILPKEVINSAQRFPESSWQQLIQEHKTFNTPHWLKGYKNVPKRQDGGEIVKDDMGYWNPDNWGKPVEIGSNIITMEGVDVPLIGISDTGDVQYMEPGEEEYIFDGETVTEYPVARNGINQADAQPIKKLDQSLNFTNYNKPTKGGWLNKYK